MEQLITHYTAKELSEEMVNKTPYTCDVYRGYIKTWISPRWDDYKIADIKTTLLSGGDWIQSILHSSYLSSGLSPKPQSQ
jgi:hypothetical protein